MGHWPGKMANITRNMNNNAKKGKGRLGSQPPRSKSTNADPSQPVTRTLKSHSTSAMESKSTNLIESMRNLNISRNRARSAVRIPVRSTSTSSNSSLQTMDDICYFMQTNKVKNVVVMAGAGISTSSGIPDFRTPGTGLYDNLRQYKIPYPEAIFDIDYFHYNPRPFFTLARDLYPNGVYRPNAVHYFCRLLYEKGMLLRMYTQNIDGLERIAGIPPSKLVEAHGTFSTATCVNCRRKYDGEEIKHEILTGKLPLCRSTLSCKGIIKPDIVFFGEELPKKFWYYLKDFPQADMLIVMGTSLEVEPFAGIVDYVRFPVPRVLFNLKAVGPFKKRRRMNDIAIKGDLVKNIISFMQALGWADDFVTVPGQPLPLDSSSAESGSETSDDKTGINDNGSRNEKETESASRTVSKASGDEPNKAEIIHPLKRNETPLQNGKPNSQTTKTETSKTTAGHGSKNSTNSSLHNNRKFHTLSAHPDRLLTKRGSTGSLLQRAPVTAPVTTRTQKTPALPRLAEAQRRVDAYKDTLEKLRRWQESSSGESSDEGSDSSSD